MKDTIEPPPPLDDDWPTLALDYPVGRRTRWSGLLIIFVLASFCEIVIFSALRPKSEVELPDVQISRIGTGRYCNVTFNGPIVIVDKTHSGEYFFYRCLLKNPGYQVSFFSIRTGTLRIDNCTFETTNP